MSSQFSISNVNVVTRETVLTDCTVTIKDGDIQEINQSAVTDAIDGKGGFLLPGFIDVHVHGGMGFDFMDASSRAYDEITHFHMMNGTTTLLATTMTASYEALEEVFKTLQSYRHPYAQIIGVHLEGPFLNPVYKGAQNPAYMIDPDLTWIKKLHKTYPNLLKQLTLAPERKNANELIQWLKENKIIAAAGHTNATFEEIKIAVSHGLSHAVHMFNGMSSLHHRDPHVAGSVLYFDQISAEIITDFIHVHPICVELLARLKNKGNLMLITDAISAAGLQDGYYRLGGLDVEMKDGVCRLKEDQALAGSSLTMLKAFQNLVKELHIPLHQASMYASYNPAKHLNLHHRIGSIEVGKQADLLLLSPHLELESVWVKGKNIWSEKQSSLK